MKISNEVLAVVSSLEIVGNTIRMAKLERGLYLKVDQVLQAMGGKWNRKAQAHVFAVDPAPIVEQVLALGEITTHKDLGFFRTPEPLARQLVEMADVKVGHLVLEPSAGDGAIVRELLRVNASVFAIERDLGRRAHLNQMMHDAPAMAVAGFDDFLEYDAIEPFDRVVMNPPFCKVGKGDHLDHVRHAFSMLVPGGVLVSVLPQGVVFRQDKRHTEFRHWIADTGARDVEGIYRRLADLPDDSFKASSTSVQTCVLRMVKP